VASSILKNVCHFSHGQTPFHIVEFAANQPCHKISFYKMTLRIMKQNIQAIEF